MRRVALVAALVLSISKATATDCPPPPKLTCEQLKSKIAERCPQTATAVKATAVPCADAKPEIKYVDRVKIVEVAVAPEPQKKYRFAFGGDLGYNEEHEALAGLHAGFLAPTTKSGGNFYFAAGPTYQNHPDISTTCLIGCRTCGASREGAGPWGVLLSGSFIWK